MIKTTDDVSLAVRDAGRHDAQACVFIHGIAQSKLTWEPVLAGPLANEYHLVAYDLRGHGGSDKPEDPSALARTRLAGDLAAVIEGLRLERPVLVASSYGGVVVGEYLRQYGDASLGGIVFVAGAVRTGREARDLFGPVMLNHARALLAEDPATYAEGARAFLQGNAAGPFASETLEAALAEMMLVPARVRRAFLTGGEDYCPEISRSQVPIATLHGDQDAVVAPAMSAMIARLRPGIRQEWLPNVGHVPWLETPEAFNAALRSVLQ